MQCTSNQVLFIPVSKDPSVYPRSALVQKESIEKQSTTKAHLTQEYYLKLAHPLFWHQRCPPKYCINKSINYKRTKYLYRWTSGWAQNNTVKKLKWTSQICLQINNVAFIWIYIHKSCENTHLHCRFIGQIMQCIVCVLSVH